MPLVARQVAHAYFNTSLDLDTDLPLFATTVAMVFFVVKPAMSGV